MGILSSYVLFQKPPSETPDSQHLGHERDLHRASNLHARVEQSFGSLAQLKATVSASALGMMGSGWVWLATNQQHDLAVIPTFGPGTLLVQSQRYQGFSPDQPVAGEALKNGTNIEVTDASAEPLSMYSRKNTGRGPSHKSFSGATTSPASGSYTSSQPPRNPLLPQSRSISSTLATLSNMRNDAKKFADTTPFLHGSVNPNLETSSLLPLFCVSVHEHAWMTDYGVWGKEEYLRNFWSALDWAKVARVYEQWTQARL